MSSKKRIEVRKCSDCGEATLLPISRDMEIYNSITRYKCETCDTDVEIKPLASIGILITVGLLVLAFWGYILFGKSAYIGNISLSIYGLAVVAFIFVTGVPLLAHFMNPIVKYSESDAPLTSNNTKHIAKKQIIWLEKFGLLGGLLAPLFFIAIFLGGALLIGYINYTYF